MLETTVDAVLFDLDGTLVDSTASVQRNWAKIAALLGRDGEDLLGDLHGMPGRQLLRIRAPELPEERVQELNKILIDGETNDTFDVVPTAGAVELLQRIPPDRWGIVTSGPLRLATARIGAAGLPMPLVLVTADDISTGKPDPEPFRLGAERLRRPADRCLAIEDAPAGITSARAAGCVVIGILTTYPELEADSIQDLTALEIDVTGAGLVVHASLVTRAS